MCTGRTNATWVRLLLWLLAAEGMLCVTADVADELVDSAARLLHAGGHARVRFEGLRQSSVIGEGKGGC